MKGILIILAGSMLLLSGTTALAAEEHGHGKGHGREEHGREEHGKHHNDAQMAKLHKMMPRYGKAQVSISAALESGDLKVIAKETAYILSTTADLKKSKPHKNPAELEVFRKIAASFEQDVKKTADSVKKGDLAGAKAAFAAARKRCDACHAKFRD